jgi:hypothetical protein
MSLSPTDKAFGCGVNHFDERQQCQEFARRVAEIADLDYYLIAGSHYSECTLRQTTATLMYVV